MILLYILVGSTASGKSSVAIPIAQNLDAEIISADSMAIYRGMNIGTAKPTVIEQKIIPHYMLDICDPGESFNVRDFVENASKIIQQIHNKGKKIFKSKKIKD